MRAAVFLAISLCAISASAQPVASGVEPARRPEIPPAPTTIPVEPPREPAPSPLEASGVASEDARSTTDRLRWIPRALLFLPRMAIWLASQPIRGAAYAFEAADLPSRTGSGGSGGGGTFAAAPLALYRSEFGATFGGSVRVSELTLRAAFGGRFEQAYGLAIGTPRFGRVRIALDATYEDRPEERLFAPDEMRFAETRIHDALTVETRLVDALYARTSGALMLRELAGPDVENVRIDQALVYDTRRASKYQSKAFPSTGWYAMAHASIAHGIEDDTSLFGIYGGEVQRFFDLYDGSRVLLLRGLVEAASGKLPVVERPQLGGAENLRGYAESRFRERRIALGTAEYRWDLGNYFAAYAFVDVGGVDDNAEALVGFGGGIQIHTGVRTVGRLQLAGSRDGDFFVELALGDRTGGFP